MKKDECIFLSILTAIGTLFAVIAIAVDSVVAKWIWGILAGIIFVFVIILFVDTIVKNKRKPKDIIDLLKIYAEEESKKPGFKEDFEKKMEASANRRNILFDGQRPEDSDYGYSLTNPIITSTVSYSNKYLADLRTLDGRSFTWTRIGSCYTEEISGIERIMVDKYQLYLNGKEYKVIYICPYGHNGSFAPKGLKLIDRKSMEREAKEKGITIEALIELRKIEAERVYFYQQEKKRERNKFEELSKKVNDIYPSFDFNAEFENPVFKKLIQAEVDMQTAYEILHKEQLLEKKETTIADQDSVCYTSEFFYNILCDNDEYLQRVLHEKIETEEELRERATISGTSIEFLKGIKKIERERDELKIKELKKEYLKQSVCAVTVKCEYPQFDLSKELSNNAFKRLILMGIDLQLAYDIININQLFNRRK